MKIFHATHRGYLKIEDGENYLEVPCAVLENEKRIISQTGLFQAFNRPRKGEKRQEGLPSIIGAKNLVPYVSEDLKNLAKPIHYYHSNGKTSVGYNAEIIPLVCEAYIKAAESGATTVSQEKIVRQANIIIRSLAKVGITALVDEATGYQYEREKDELQKLLSKYVAEDFLKWQSRFPRKFYQEAFRLHKWEYDPSSLKRPGYLGKFTNRFVYEYMPPGVLEELRKKNPTKSNGRRSRKHHQHLTEEVGISHLDKHLTKLITVMELSDNMDDFTENFNRVFNKSYQIRLQLE